MLFRVSLLQNIICHSDLGWKGGRCVTRAAGLGFNVHLVSPFKLASALVIDHVAVDLVLG